LLAGKKVEVEKTRAFGCSTKWADKRDAVKKYNEDWLKREVTLEEIKVDALKKLIKNDTEKVKIVNLWATYCGPCIEEFPSLVKINRQFENRGVELVTLSADQLKNKARVHKFLKSENCAITKRIMKTMAKEGRTSNNYILNISDTEVMGDVIDEKWSGALPHTIVIAPGGKVLFRHTGEIDEKELKKVLVDHLGNTYK
jgi:thiol-disulfide isomerase/thioredoxin